MKLKPISTSELPFSVPAISQEQLRKKKNYAIHFDGSNYVAKRLFCKYPEKKFSRFPPHYLRDLRYYFGRLDQLILKNYCTCLEETEAAEAVETVIKRFQTKEDLQKIIGKTLASDQRLGDRRIMLQELLEVYRNSRERYLSAYVVIPEFVALESEKIKKTEEELKRYKAAILFGTEEYIRMKIKSYELGESKEKIRKKNFNEVFHKYSREALEQGLRGDKYRNYLLKLIPEAMGEPLESPVREIIETTEEPFGVKPNWGDKSERWEYCDYLQRRDDADFMKLFAPKPEKSLKDMILRRAESDYGNYKKRKRLFYRKARLNRWNYFVSFTNDGALTEEEFKKQLLKCLSNLATRHRWRYMGVWERGEENERLHLHILAYVPFGEMIGTCEVKRDFSVKRGAMTERNENSFFAERFGRNDFKPLETDSETPTPLINYIAKYLRKQNKRAVYSRRVPSAVIKELPDSALICPLYDFSEVFVIDENYVDFERDILNAKLGENYTFLDRSA